MNIVLVHDWLTGMRGGEKCLEVLCRRFPYARLFTLLHRRGSTTPAIERMAIRTSFLQHLPGSTRWYRHLLPLMPSAIERLTMPREIGLVLSFSHAAAKGVRVPAGVPHVCYCFTPMRYVWDLRQEYFGSRRGLIPSLRNALLDRLQRWDCANSDGVTQFVAPSRTVADRIATCYDRTSSVIYPPVDTEFYTPANPSVGNALRGVPGGIDDSQGGRDSPDTSRNATEGVPYRDDFYLCVSALAPYKRLDLAIDACNRLKRKLVIIGSGPELKLLTKLAGPTVSFLGWRSNEEIRDHLRRCRALLFPGTEDFGIVPVEAQACGTAVIALARGGATETVVPAAGSTPGSGIFFDEPVVESLIEAMLSYERDPDQCSPHVARQQALRFAAEHYEGNLLALLQRVARKSRRVDSDHPLIAPPQSRFGKIRPQTAEAIEV